MVIVFCPKSLGLRDFWMVKKVYKMRKKTFSSNKSFIVQVEVGLRAAEMYISED